MTHCLCHVLAATGSALMYPLVLGGLSRWHGSQISTDKVYESLMYATPYAFAVALASGDWLSTLLVLGATAAAKSAPHEAFMDDGFKTGELQRESWVTKCADFLTFGHERDTTLWCSVGWAVKGLIIASSSALVFAGLGDTERAVQILAFGTASSVIGYSLGWTWLRNRPKWMKSTMWGEFLSGFIAGLGLVK